jgi:hypothetical protein
VKARQGSLPTAIVVDRARRNSAATSMAAIVKNNTLQSPGEFRARAQRDTPPMAANNNEDQCGSNGPAGPQGGRPPQGVYAIARAPTHAAHGCDSRRTYQTKKPAVVSHPGANREFQFP